jgi:hypothetical protein
VHLNFYENLNEAQRRLRNTVVLYDDVPYLIWAITGHHFDGVFRVYMQAVGTKARLRFPISEYGPESLNLGRDLDRWMTDHPEEEIVRKQMNSPKFKKFRPFPLGMVVISGEVHYLERGPVRNGEQGLTKKMISASALSVGPNPANTLARMSWGMMDSFIKNCIVADHPTFQQALSGLNSSEFTNSGVAFHRNFALLKGPVDTLFLAYKQDVIGVLPMNDSGVVRLAQDAYHLKEVVEELGVFGDVIV